MRKVEIVKYAVYFVLLTFLHYTESIIGISAFSVAFFFGLVYNRNNLLVLAPLYVASAVIVDFGWQSAVIAVIPPIVASLALFIHYKIRKKLSVPAVTAYAVVSALPRIAFSLGSIGEVVAFSVGTLLIIPLTYVFVSVQYLVLVKKFAFKLTYGEFFSVIVALVVVGAGLSVPSIKGVKVYYAAMTFAVLIAVFVGRGAGITVALALGTGGSLSGNIEVMAISALYGGLIACFNPSFGYIGGISALAFNALGIALGYIEGEYYVLVAPAIGIIISIVVPNSVKRKISTFNRGSSDGLTRSIINKDRAETALKIECLGSALKEMSSAIVPSSARPEINSDEIAKEVSAKCCGSCPMMESCVQALGGNSTDVALKELTESAVYAGRASILDASPFLSSRCRRLNGIITATNEFIAKVMRKTAESEAFDEDKKLLKEQVEGLAEVLDGISTEIAEPLTYNKSVERAVLEAYNTRSVAVNDVCVTGERVSFTVSEQDAQKPKIIEILESVIGKAMRLTSSVPTVNGKVDLFFEPAPRYRIAYGERVISAFDDGCGDKETVIKIGTDKAMIVLSDGMGHGRNADENSSRAVKLISSFYKAGLDHATVLKSVARLMKLGAKEEFNAIDIAVIDVFTGETDIIKQGARESYLVDNGEVVVIGRGSLPLGIVDEIVPFTDTVTLTTQSFLVLVSDGVSDVIGVDGMVELLSSLDTRNPDDIAEAVMNNTMRIAGKERDDASVIVVRLF